MPNEIISQLIPKQPYQFKHLLAILKRYPHASTDTVADDRFLRVIDGDEGSHLFEVTQNLIDKSTLRVTCLSHEVPTNIEPYLDKLAWILAVEEDRQSFWQYAKDTPKLWDVLQPLHGLPLIRTTSIFEALINVIIEQHISWKSAQKAQQWLVQWGGERIFYDGRSYFSYPTPAKIASVDLETLLPLKITHSRIELILKIARDIKGGKLDLEKLRFLPPQRAYDFLISIKGIGHWTASVVLGRAFGDFIYVPHNDVALQAATNHYFLNEEGRISSDTVNDIFAEFGDHAGLAAHFTLLRWVLDRYPIQDDD